MKQIIYLITIQLILVSSLAGQITITNGIFPAVGDTLKTVISLMPMGIDLKSPGPDQNWDFSQVQLETELDVRFDAAINGTSSDQFPDATLVSIIPPSSERYLTVDADQVAEVGFVGIDPIVQQLMITSIYSDPYVLQRAPLNYEDSNYDSSRLVTTLPWDTLPDAIKDLVPVSPDSIRINIDVVRRSEVDAWGSVSIPAGTYDVLRERSIETRNTSLEAFSVFGWTDVTQLFKGALPDPTVLDPISTEAYVFLSNERKEPIASITLDSNGVANRAQFYRAGPVSTRDKWQHVEARLSPNPTYGKSSLYYSGLPADTYQVWVYDLLGKAIQHSEYQMEGSGSVKCNFGNLSKGTYLYSLKDRSGEIITTKRLVIINP